jgi:raffinose/stachyose/melibiose transport system substrate-binding protein
MEERVMLMRILKVLTALSLSLCLAFAAGAQGKVTIRIMTRMAGADPLSKFVEQVKADFIALHPNVTIQDDSMIDEQSYNNKLKIDIATGNVPSVFYFPAIAGLTEWAKAGVLMDLTPVIAGDKAWSDGFITGSTDIWNLSKYGVNGRFAVPYQMAPEVIWYNPELFAKAGVTKVPETIDELFVAIDKLKAAKIVPWGLGGKDTWRAGHIFNNIVYRTGGVDFVRDIGARKAKWTDPQSIEALTLLKDFAKRGAFDKGFIGMSYDDEKAGFFAGKYAMTCNGTWFLSDIRASSMASKVKFFTFPYVAKKPQFKGDSIIFPGGLMLSGKMSGAEKEMAIEFLKMFTGKKEATSMLVDHGNMSARRDMDISKSGLDPLTKDVVAYMGTVTNPGGDYSDYDLDIALLEKSRVAIQGMLLRDTPATAAKTFQNEIDKFEKSKK